VGACTSHDGSLDVAISALDTWSFVKRIVQASCRHSVRYTKSIPSQPVRFIGWEITSFGSSSCNSTEFNTLLMVQYLYLTFFIGRDEEIPNPIIEPNILHSSNIAGLCSTQT